LSLDMLTDALKTLPEDFEALQKNHPGLVLVLAPSGVMLRLFSPWATGMDLPPDWHTVRDPYGFSLIVGLVIKETCFLIMALSAALSQVPAGDLLRQASTLGYGTLKGWAVAVAPRLQRQLGLPTAAVLAYGLGNVDLALTLGPDLPPTFAVVLWRWLLDTTPDIQAQAHAGTLVLLGLTLAALLAVALLGRAARAALSTVAGSGRRRVADHWLRRAVVALSAIGLALGLLSMLAILLRSAAGPWRFPSLLPTGLSLSSWADALPAAGQTLRTTAGLAAITAIVAVVAVLPAAEAVRDRPAARTRLGQWLFVPLLLPQMTFLFGIQVLLVRAHIDGTWFAVAWMHLIFALPYVWGVLAPARAALDTRLVQVAATLGATPAQAWRRVTLPLLTRATLLAAALGMSVSLALYLPTLFAGAGRVSTAATEAAAAAGSGSLRLAAVHAILLTLGPLLAFALAYALGAALFRHRRDVP
ncbi:MAG: ABC transporter permease, partial [Pseudomonadota bacterium]